MQKRRTQDISPPHRVDPNDTRTYKQRFYDNHPDAKEQRQERSKLARRQKRRDAGIPEKVRKPEEYYTQIQRQATANWRKNNPDKIAEANERNRLKQWNSRRERNAPLKPITPFEQRTKFAINRAEIQRNREAKKMNTTTEKVDYTSILVRDNGICYICQQNILPEHTVEFDHIIPLSKGGTHTKNNIKVTHRACNQRKKAKLPSELTDWDRRGP